MDPDCEPFTLKKTPAFFRVSRVFCVWFSLFERENSKKLMFLSVKMDFNFSTLLEFKNNSFLRSKTWVFCCFHVRKVKITRKKSEKTRKNARDFLSVNGSQSGSKTVVFKRVFSNFCLLGTHWPIVECTHFLNTQ